MDGLEARYDSIVIGTGLTESIIAAAIARTESSVLHIDKNDFYGDCWSSFNLKNLREFLALDKVDELGQSTKSDSSPEHPLSDELLNENERYLAIDNRPLNQHFSDVEEKWHVDKQKSAGNPNLPLIKPSEILKLLRPPASSHDDTENSPKTPVNEQPESTASNAAEAPTKPTLDKSLGGPSDLGAKGDAVSEGFSESIKIQQTHEEKALSDAEKLSVYRSYIEQEWRKFSIDLSSKIFCSRGPLVELLITSGVGRYAEFKCVERILTHIDDQFNEVPVSRADVFQSDQVSMLEKRRLMKFITSLMNIEPPPPTVPEDGSKEKTFLEFLNEENLSPMLKHYVYNAIAMANPSTTLTKVSRRVTMKGLSSVRKFLGSVGRFGNSPFLATLYGSGEIPQCFCRLCAVFGGTYCLRRPIEALILSTSPLAEKAKGEVEPKIDEEKEVEIPDSEEVGNESRCVGIVSDGQRIDCNQLILGPTYVPSELSSDSNQLKTTDSRMVHRAVLFTTTSLKPTDGKEMISLIHWLPAPDSLVPVICLELPSTSYCTPQHIYMVQLTSESKESISAFIQQFFESSSESICYKKPNIIWSLRFAHPVNRVSGLSQSVDNIVVCDWPNVDLDCHNNVEQARSAFSKLWPDHQFLPTPPSPEEAADNNENDENTDESRPTNGFVREEKEKPSVPESTTASRHENPDPAVQNVPMNSSDDNSTSIVKTVGENVDNNGEKESTTE